MPARPYLLALLAASLGAVALPRPAESQITKRLKDAAKRTADAAKQAAQTEARREIDHMLAAVTGEAVADGRFAAVLTPWSAADGSARAEYARVAGWATVVSTGGGYQLLLCEESESQPWSSSVTVQPAQPERPTRRARPAPGPAAAAPAAPSDREYSLPSPLVRIAVADSRVRMQGEPRGTFTLDAITDSLWVGTARVVFPSATLPGVANPQEVELGATFRARLLAPGEPRPSCAAARPTRE